MDAEPQAPIRLTRWNVITGAPCSGKTSVINELARKGFRVVPEAARAYLDDELKKGRLLSEIKADPHCFEGRIFRAKLRLEARLPAACGPDERPGFAALPRQKSPPGLRQRPPTRFRSAGRSTGPKWRESRLPEGKSPSRNTASAASDQRSTPSAAGRSSTSRQRPTRSITAGESPLLDTSSASDGERSSPAAVVAVGQGRTTSHESGAKAGRQ